MQVMVFEVYWSPFFISSLLLQPVIYGLIVYPSPCSVVKQIWLATGGIAGNPKNWQRPGVIGLQFSAFGKEGKKILFPNFVFEGKAYVCLSPKCFFFYQTVPRVTNGWFWHAESQNGFLTKCLYLILHLHYTNSKMTVHFEQTCSVPSGCLTPRVRADRTFMAPPWALDKGVGGTYSLRRSL